MRTPKFQSAATKALNREMDRELELEDACERLLEWMRYVKLPVGEPAKRHFAADLDAAREALKRGRS
jgi:hypothetical protein